MRGNDVLVIGAQWGDEGKGRIVDLLAGQADAVLRFNGGHNAGHAIVVDGVRHALALLPSGIVRGVRSFIGPGVVVDLPSLLNEIDTLAARGIDTSPAMLMLAENATLVLTVHAALDRAQEARRGVPVGSTLRGIGPAYEDRAGRRAVRLADLHDDALWRCRVAAAVDHHNLWLAAAGAATFDPHEVIRDLQPLVERVKPYVGPVHEVLRDLREQGRRVLLEGAQAAMLDVDWGAYPFVTSSGTIGPAGSLARGARVLGVCKAYATRVGGGPFPTELHGDTGRVLRDRGGEYGTNTGRPRRCGWLDAVQLRHAVRVAGIDALALTKIDVMDGLDEVRVAVAYRLDGALTENLPLSADAQARAEPVYETWPGWAAPTQGVRDVAALPPQALAFVRRIETLAGVPVEWLSTGAERDHCVHLQAAPD